MLLSAKTWSQSCEMVVEPDVPRIPVVTLPSNSNTLRTLGVTRSSNCSTWSGQRRKHGLRSGRPACFRARLGGAIRLGDFRLISLVRLMRCVSLERRSALIERHRLRSTARIERTFSARTQTQLFGGEPAPNNAGFCLFATAKLILPRCQWNSENNSALMCRRRWLSAESSRGSVMTTVVFTLHVMFSSPIN